MATVEILDRSSLIAGLYRELVLDPRQTAIVTIDMHRGHLDMDVATMPAKPEDAKRVIANARAALGELDRLVPGRKSTVREHNVEGSPGTQIIPELYASGDYVINNKKRLDCFYGTDLRQLLDTLGVKNVVFMGINTNTCVLNTSFTAFNFDYRVVVLSDCVASMYGDDLHALGLQNVARCLGWVITNEQLFEKIRASAPAAARKAPADALAK